MTLPSTRPRLEGGKNIVRVAKSGSESARKGENTPSCCIEGVTDASGLNNERFKRAQRKNSSGHSASRQPPHPPTSRPLRGSLLNRIHPYPLMNPRMSNLPRLTSLPSPLCRSHNHLDSPVPGFGINGSSGTRARLIPFNITKRDFPPGSLESEYPVPTTTLSNSNPTTVLVSAIRPWKPVSHARTSRPPTSSRACYRLPPGSLPQTVRIFIYRGLKPRKS